MWATVWQQLNTSETNFICRCHLYLLQPVPVLKSLMDSVWSFKVSVTFWWVIWIKMVNLLHIAQAYPTMSCIGVDIIVGEMWVWMQVKVRYQEQKQQDWTYVVHSSHRYTPPCKNRNHPPHHRCHHSGRYTVLHIQDQRSHWNILHIIRNKLLSITLIIYLIVSKT